MKYAPVLIPTLCRSEHLIRCVESLRHNTWADKTDVYVGLDYPIKESHWPGYLEIKQYLGGDFPEFRSFRVFVRDRNYGSSANIGALILSCAKDHDRYICAEDDLEVSPNFLQYMDKALMEYEDDDDIIAVTGYSYPLRWIADPSCTVVKQNFTGSAWGRGFWIRKRVKMQQDLKHNALSRSFSFAYRAGKFDRMIDFAVKDYVSFTRNGWGGKHAYLNRSTDVATRIYLAVKDKYMIMPLMSKVRNHGYDGSGQNCQKLSGDRTGEFCVDNYPFETQPIDTGTDFVLKEDCNFPMDQNRQLLNRFDKVPPEIMDRIWKEAEQIAAGGKYYGLKRRIGKLFK